MEIRNLRLPGRFGQRPVWLRRRTVFGPPAYRLGKLDQRKAFASSVGAILPLCLVSAAVYGWKGALDLSLAWPYLAGGFAGGLLSGRIFRKVPVDWLRRAFGLLILYGGVRGVMGL